MTVDQRHIVWPAEWMTRRARTVNIYLLGAQRTSTAADGTLWTFHRGRR